MYPECQWSTDEGRRSGRLRPLRSTFRYLEVYSGDDPKFEMPWVRSGGFFIGAIYNPPKPQYHLQSLIAYIDGCVQELLHDFPTAQVVIAGDFNQIPETDLVAATAWLHTDRSSADA